MRSRESRLRHRKSKMSRVIMITDERAKSFRGNFTHSRIRRRRHDRRSTRIEHYASPKRVAVLRHRHRKSGMPRVVPITDERSLYAVTSSVHACAGAATIAVQLASKRDIAKALQGQQVEFGAVTASFKYPGIRFGRSNSRYHVTPHRTSCPCLVSFSVGHYDVLVSTPDSMFSVV